MYYDIFFNNPLAEIVREPDEEQRLYMQESGLRGTLITFPGPKRAIVYAVSERVFPANVVLNEGDPATPEIGFLHCLVTDEQLNKIEADNVAFKFFEEADARFKRPDGTPPHVFNPAGLISRKNGENHIVRVGSSQEVALVPVE